MDDQKKIALGGAALLATGVAIGAVANGADDKTEHVAAHVVDNVMSTDRPRNLVRPGEMGVATLTLSRGARAENILAVGFELQSATYADAETATFLSITARNATNKPMALMPVIEIAEGGAQ